MSRPDPRVTPVFRPRLPWTYMEIEEPSAGWVCLDRELTWTGG
jgi:hypothetical protein